MLFIKDTIKIALILAGGFFMSWYLVTAQNYHANILLDREEAMMNYRHAKCMDEVGLEFFPGLEVTTEEDARQWDLVRSYYACSTKK